MGARRRWVGCFGPFVVALASCGGTASPTDGGAPDAPDSPPADVCTLDMHTCVATPPGTYCWYLVASAVDEARHCRAPYAIERCEPGAGYGDGANHCYHVRPDGGVAQTVITPTNWPETRREPGFTPCTTDEYVAATALPACP